MVDTILVFMGRSHATMEERRQMVGQRLVILHNITCGRGATLRRRRYLAGGDPVHLSPQAQGVTLCKSPTLL